MATAVSRTALWRWRHARARASRGARLLLATVLGVFWLAWPAGAAWAAGVLVSTDLFGQGYQVRDASGRFLNLRRLDANLRIYVYDILPEPKDPVEKRRPHPQMYFVTLMRLDADFGNFAKAAGSASNWVHEDWPTRPMFQLLYGYLGVTGLMRGWVELKLGRQFHWDAMDIYFFDGLTAELKTPWHVKLSVFGGARVNGVLPIDAPILLLDGTSPVESPLRWAPAFGVAVESINVKYVKARAAYRRTFSGIKNPEATTPIYIYPDGNGAEDIPRWATAEEKVTATVFVDLFSGKLSPYAGFAYNIATDRFARALGGIRSVWGRHTVSAEYVRHEPDFDADSIFNIFNTMPFTETRLTYELKITKEWAGYVMGALRLFQGGDEDEFDSGSERKELTTDPGAGVGVTYRNHRLAGRADGYWQEGYGGRTLGLDVQVKHEVLPGILQWEARATVVHWNDDLQAQLKGVTAGVALGAAWRIHPIVALHVLAEENFGQFYKSDFRLYTVVELSWCYKGYCPAGLGSM